MIPAVPEHILGDIEPLTQAADGVALADDRQPMFGQPPIRANDTERCRPFAGHRDQTVSNGLVDDKNSAGCFHGPANCRHVVPVAILGLKSPLSHPSSRNAQISPRPPNSLWPSTITAFGVVTFRVISASWSDPVSVTFQSLLITPTLCVACPMRT